MNEQCVEGGSMNYHDWLAQQDLETCTFKEAFKAGAAVKEAEIAAIKQAISDPENQPSQFGTVTVEMFVAVSNERDQLREQVAMLRELIPARLPESFVSFGPNYAELETMFAEPFNKMSKFKLAYLDECEKAIAATEPK